MDFHFVKLIHEGTYLSLVDPKQKPRFVCFAERSKADKCVDYMADFRYRYGHRSTCLLTEES